MLLGFEFGQVLALHLLQYLQIMDLSHITIFLLLLFHTLQLQQTDGQATNQALPLSPASFGPNKPHLLFHLGTRQAFSTNYGLGYWLDNPLNRNRSYFTKERLSYENTDNDLYVDIKVSNGETIVGQEIKDNRYGVTSQVNFQMAEEQGEQFWEQEFKIQKERSEGSDEYKDHHGYWFTYITIENTDPQQVDTQSHFSPLIIVPTKQTPTQLSLTIKDLRNPQKNQQIQISSEQPLKFFGFSVNISETYDIRNLIAQAKHLIEVEKYEDVERKIDDDYRGWEDRQIELMRRADWIGGKYVVGIVYGQFEENNQVYITNSTKRTTFNSPQFTSTSQKLLHKHFPITHTPHQPFLTHVLYNLFGGLTFYYGRLYTQNSILQYELDYCFSFTPSRLIFPRSFLWDDGFHMDIVVHYQPVVVMKVLKNWFRKVDMLGWIGREQIRGFQVASMLPDVKFVYQDTFQMNPPTLIIPILTLLRRANSKQQEQTLSERQILTLKQLLSQNYHKLQKWFNYFIKTQTHTSLTEKQSIKNKLKYRWQCKDDCEKGNFMGSGLDDYPRIQQERQISKQHVDLMSWMYFFCDGLEKIGGFLGEEKASKYYEGKKKELLNKMVAECYDKQDHLFKDTAVKSKTQYIDTYITKIGYINLFPFLTGVLQPQPHHSPKTAEKLKQSFKQTISIMMDENQLMSQDGLRSLSISDPQYGTDDNYWRGPVWLPINYMVLRACKKYYWGDTGVKELYDTLRERLIETVERNYEQTGYLFENYHLGKGNRGFPFYGWSSLIVNIITQQY